MKARGRRFWFAKGPFPGDGYIAGTIADPNGIVPGVRVALLETGSMRQVGITVADIDSNWRFSGLSQNHTFMSVASDPNEEYNGARSDRVVPVV